MEGRDSGEGGGDLDIFNHTDFIIDQDRTVNVISVSGQFWVESALN